MPNPGDNIWLHRYALLTATATFILIIAGALVTSNDAGLAVPDWPLSYGQLMPPMPGNIFYEHSHRLVATTVGILTIGLAFWLQLRERRRWVRVLGWIALGAVILQGILGGITVLYFLPPAVSIAHASLAQLFFCIMVSLALFTSAGWRFNPPPDANPSGGLPLFHAGLATTAAVYCQLLLGAATRHSVLGVMPHVLGAVVVTFLGLFASAIVFRRYSEVPLLRRPGALLAALIIVQVFLGFGSYVVKYVRDDVQPLPLAVIITTAHVACGALVLASSLVLTMRARRITGARSAAEAVASSRTAAETAT